MNILESMMLLFLQELYRSSTFEFFGYNSECLFYNAPVVVEMYLKARKKFEIVVRNGSEILPLSFWQNGRSKSSEIYLRYPMISDAYLLLNPLFVAPIGVMITCGQTRLIDAALLFLNLTVPMCWFFISEKRIVPQMQFDFSDDVYDKKYVPGNIFELGNSQRPRIFITMKKKRLIR